MSRTDHPRIVGTHRAGHVMRENAKEDCRLPVRPVMSVSQALAEFEPEHDLSDLPGLKRLGPIEWASWWAQVSDRATEQWLDESERLADWERDLLDLPEGTVWYAKSGEQYADTQGYESEDDFAEDLLDEEADADHWLTGDPRDFFQSVGDGWLIEGPSVTRPEPLRAGHYVRVYELARELGIESKALIRHLRNAGEYVRGAQSFVAMPVADRLRAIADVLVDTYGARKAERDPNARLRVLLAEEARHAMAKTRRPIVRPGAPRPGNNPFSPAYARSN